MNMKVSLIFDSPKVLNMDYIGKISRHFSPRNLMHIKEFHLSKAFSLPQAITGSPENSKNSSSEAPNSDDADRGDKFKTCCPIDIDMDDMDNDINDIDAKVSKEEVPQPKRRGFYMSKGISIHIPEKNMPPGTCKYRIDTLPPSEPDDIRVIKFGKP